MEGRDTISLMASKTLPRMPIQTLVIRESAKVLKEMFPSIKRLHLVGSRLRHKYGRDLDFVAVGNGLEGHNWTVKVGNLVINLFGASHKNVEPAILEFGLGMDIIRWKKKAASMGYQLNRYGLWRKKILVTAKMSEISSLLGLPLKPNLVYTLRNPL